MALLDGVFVALHLFNVTVYVFATHTPYNVKLAVGEILAPEAYVIDVAPLLVVVQPHVYPVLVIVGSVTDPPVHLAYNVAVPSLVQRLDESVYPDTLATNAGVAALLATLVVGDAHDPVYQPSNVYVLVNAVVLETVASLALLFVIVNPDTEYDLVGLVIALNVVA